MISSTDHYVPVVTLVINDNIKFFWRTWSKDLEEQYLGTNIGLKHQHNQETTA